MIVRQMLRRVMIKDPGGALSLPMSRWRFRFRRRMTGWARGKPALGEPS
jgi:hypothetical protein